MLRWFVYSVLIVSLGWAGARADQYDACDPAKNVGECEKTIPSCSKCTCSKWGHETTAEQRRSFCKLPNSVKLCTRTKNREYKKKHGEAASYEQVMKHVEECQSSN